MAYPPFSGSGSATTSGQTAAQVDAAIQAALANVDAEKYLGTLGAGGDFAQFPAANAGEFVIARADATINTVTVRQGHRYRCTTDGTAQGTGANWAELLEPPIVDFSALVAGDVPMANATGDGLTASGARQIGTNLIMPETTQLQSRAAFLGSSGRLLSTGSFLNIQNTVTDMVYEVVDYEAPGDDASGPASRIAYAAREASFTNVVNAPVGDRRNVAVNNKSFEWDAGFFGRVWEFRFTFASAVTNFRMRIVDNDNGRAVYSFPNEMAWETGEGGPDYAAGEIDIPLQGVTAPMFASPSITYRVELRADGGTLTERASDSLPAMGILRQLASRVVLQDRGALTPLGTIGTAAADFQDWPAAHAGEYVRANADITIGGVDLTENDWWVCERDETAAGTAANWARVVFPASGGSVAAPDPAQYVADNVLPVAKSDNLINSRIAQTQTFATVTQSTDVTLRDESGTSTAATVTNVDFGVDFTLSSAQVVNALGLRMQRADAATGASPTSVRLRVTEIRNTTTNSVIYDDASGDFETLRFLGDAFEDRFVPLTQDVALPADALRVTFTPQDRFALRGRDAQRKHLIGRYNRTTRIADQVDLGKLTGVTAHTIPRAEGDSLEDSVLVQVGNTVAVRRDGTFALLAPETGATYAQAPTTGNSVDLTLSADQTINSVGLSAQRHVDTNALGLPVFRNTLSVRIDRILRTDTNAELYNNQSGPVEVIRHIPAHPTVYYFSLNTEVDLPQNVPLRFEIEVDANGAEILTQTDGTTFALYGHGGVDYPVLDSARTIATSGGLEGGGDLSTDLALSIADDGVTADKLAPAAFANGTQVNQATATDLIVSPYRLQNRLETLSFDRFRGTIAASGADLGAFPAADRGDYVVAAASPGTVNGTALVAGTTYRCTTNNTTANTPANWQALPVPEVTLADTGWITLSPRSPWGNFGGSWPSRYRRIGDVVYVQLAVSTASTVSGAVQVPTILPASVRPLRFVTFHWVSGSAYRQGVVNTNGNIQGVNLASGNASTLSSANFSFPVG